MTNEQRQQIRDHAVRDIAYRWLTIRHATLD